MHKSQVQMDKRLKHKTSAILNLIEEKGGSTVEYIVIGDHFLIINPVAPTLIATINKRELLKLRSFPKAKDMVNKTIYQLTEWEKIFTNPRSDRGLISKIYEKLKRLNIKRTKIQ